MRAGGATKGVVDLDERDPVQVVPHVLVDQLRGGGYVRIDRRVGPGEKVRPDEVDYVLAAQHVGGHGEDRHRRGRIDVAHCVGHVLIHCLHTASHQREVEAERTQNAIGRLVRWVQRQVRRCARGPRERTIPSHIVGGDAIVPEHHIPVLERGRVDRDLVDIGAVRIRVDGRGRAGAHRHDEGL